MMFMMPIPPTSSEMAAMPPRKTVKTPVIWLATSVNDSCDITLKSSSASERMSWRERRMEVTSVMALATCSESTTATEIWLISSRAFERVMMRTWAVEIG
ncbi:MAG: hypothetical protein ABIG03_00340, partial [Candidatus Eisenbacteria bacterium]